MGKEKQNTKKPISHEFIYKIMQWLPVAVGLIYFLINVLKKNSIGMLTIGICLIVLLIVFVGMNIRKVKIHTKELVASVTLPLLIFVISLNSGEAYSDDFPMFLAVIGLTGMFLEPKFTRIQVVLCDVLLVIMYLIHPEKAESLSQYIMCGAIFTLSAVLFSMVIKRGRAFIEISEERAKEAEKLLESIRCMGMELEADFTASANQIESSTLGLREGSASIGQGAEEVAVSCGQVHEKIAKTQNQIEQLNQEVRRFETALGENRENINAMNGRVHSVGSIVSESTIIFRAMEEQMNEIVNIAKQISDISFKLTILSLNAAVEAAHAGASGSGFEVLANEMRELSVTSNGFSERVSEAVKQLLERVESTSEQFSGSEVALEETKRTMVELGESFTRLTEQFTFLYDNIELQNQSVNEIDAIFGNLNRRVSDMQNSSVANQNGVEAIIRAMDIYKGNINRVVDNTRNI